MHNFEKIFNIQNHSDFKKQCLDIYHFQYQNNYVYQNYCNMICENPININEINKIPFLPISFFKTKKYYPLINLKKYFIAVEPQQSQEANISFLILNFIRNLS